MTWFGETRIETASGLIYDYADPKPSQVCLADVAHGLGNTCRFGGHTSKFYSVAQHCVLVSEILEAWDQDLDVVVAGLFHDAHEAYLGDLPKPLKSQIGPEYERLAEAADEVIFESLNIDLGALSHETVKEADNRALVAEARLLMPSEGLTRDLDELGKLPDGVAVRTSLRFQGTPKDLFLGRAGFLGVDGVG